MPTGSARELMKNIGSAENTDLTSRNLHNKTFMMKNLHKFFNKEDLPWVKLVWETYYNSHLPGQRMEGSSWWKGHLKLIPLFKNHYKCIMGNGQSILLWYDSWLDEPLTIKFPELHPFVKNDLLSAESWISEEDPSQLLHNPLSELAYGQFIELPSLAMTHWSAQREDTWIGVGQTQRYSFIKMISICQRAEDNQLFKWTWKTANRLRHKIFF